jgi:DNA-binding SARP family transcriptional activator
MPRRAKLVPPAIPAWFVARPTAMERLSHAPEHRLTTVIAGPGFGKSTLLAAWAADVGAAWYTTDIRDAALPDLMRGLVDALAAQSNVIPAGAMSSLNATPGTGDERRRAEALAADLTEILGGHLLKDLVLILDDAHEIGPASPGAHLLEAITRQAPPTFHLVLSSRAEPPFPIERLRGRGQVLAIGSPTLTFSEEEVRQLLAAELDDQSATLAGALNKVTQGWPAALRLAVEMLRSIAPSEREASLERLRAPEGPLFSYMAEEVFAAEPESVRKLLRRAALFDRFTAGLCQAIGASGAPRTLAGLVRRGLFIQEVGGGWLTLHGLVRDFLLEQWPLALEERKEMHSRAAAWLEAQGSFEDVLRSRVAADDVPAVVRTLAEQGQTMIVSGGAQSVVDAVRALPAAALKPWIEQLLGEALHVRGDWDGAMASLTRAAGEDGPIAPRLAWRIGLIHDLRGEPELALRAYGRGRIDGTNLGEEGLLLAQTASARWRTGDLDGARPLAARAMEVAVASGAPQALAAAHQIVAILEAHDGLERQAEARSLVALEAAERAHDVPQTVRLRANRGAGFRLMGRYGEAMSELDAAIRLCRLNGLAVWLAFGLWTRGDVLFQLGRSEEAIADFEEAKRVCLSQGSRMVCFVLASLGDVHRERGNLALARAAYEEAASVAERSREFQPLMLALCGLARLTVAEDPNEAVRLVEASAAYGGQQQAVQLVAAGWVALASGDRARAESLGVRAGAEARRRLQRQTLAESLELQAMAAGNREVTKRLLEEVLEVWREISNPQGEARIGFALAILEAGPESRLRADRAERQLRDLGIRTTPPLSAGLLASLPIGEQPPVSIRTLGGFSVLRSGVPVAVSDWQSKKARDLLKVLISRRGRATPRELLMETLWPEGDPKLLSNRLSVALATVRSVLDVLGNNPSDHFVTADGEAVALNLTHVAVDVEAFLAESQEGQRLWSQGRAGAARAMLESAEAIYGGDFLEEDRYEDWAAPLREEARAAYISVARALGQMAKASGEHDAAVRFYLRILEWDPYDEDAHLTLIGVLDRAGRHGEARRRYRSYVERMSEIDVEPAPLPGRQSTGRADVVAAEPHG